MTFKRILLILGISFFSIAALIYFSVFSIKKNLHPSEAVVLKDVAKVSSNTNFFLFPEQTKNQIVHYSQFSLSYNENAEQADWVAYRLYPNSINRKTKRKNNFRSDLKIVTSSASLEDYKGSGYDRGHLAPARAMSYNQQSMSESFLMSNISPQKPSFNRGVWKKLENQVIRWSNLSDSLYVVTGPVLDSPLGSIGVNNVVIPRVYYKVIMKFSNNKISAIGFLLENKKTNKKIINFSTSIDNIESITGLNFFHLLEDKQQQELERANSYNQFSNE